MTNPNSVLDYHDDASTISGPLLCEALVDLLSLQLIAKHAHWNVYGASFRSVHEQFDELAATAANHADELAERAATLGHAPNGLPVRVSTAVGAPEIPPGGLEVTDALTWVENYVMNIAERFAATAIRLDCDCVSSDLCTGIVSDFERHAWMLRAHRARRLRGPRDSTVRPGADDESGIVPRLDASRVTYTRSRTKDRQMINNTAPDTIVLVHGFWVTPRSWEGWINHYEQKGYNVLAPAYPGFEVEVEALNADPTPIEQVTIPQILDQLQTTIDGLDRPPILMGHSAGGAIVQVLLDRGRGAVGVAMNSAPTEGVRVAPISQLKSTFPVFKNPTNRHRAVGLDFDQWKYAFTNTFPEEEALRLYERYHIPASGNIVWGGVLANLKPGHQDVWVDYRNDARPPLLFISGSEDHIMPPKVQQSNAKHYKSDTVTEVRLYEGFAHLLPAQEGWEQIADEALEWATRNAVSATAA